MNSLIKNIFEDEKKKYRICFCFCDIVPYLVYFGQGKEKVQCPHNQAIKNGLNEATLLK